MARLIDLGGGDQGDANATHDAALQDEPPDRTARGVIGTLVLRPDDPNIGLLSAALVCYPIAIQLARYLDLTSLHELSRTCRRVRAALLQYRAHLISKTLRCANEHEDPAIRLGNALHASFQVWNAYGHDGVKIGRITSGKLGACARDLVDACRRCGLDVCRNCVVKPPMATMLRSRHRRLCRTCMKAPIERLTTIQSRPITTFRRTSQDPKADVDEWPASTTTTWSRTPCTCDERVWICQPCGYAMYTADTTYARGWAWRTRYSACGGMGAGLGEGNEGVECGRSGGGATCLAAHEVEHEIECDADEAAALERELQQQHGPGAGGEHDWSGSSYTMHEMVGIGGRVKKKLRKMVAVGAAVKEYEDERTTGKFLVREQNGTNRSWCSWCARVVPSRKDRANMTAVQSEKEAHDTIVGRTEETPGAEDSSSS